jgi:hypothetical protein
MKGVADIYMNKHLDHRIILTASILFMIVFVALAGCVGPDTRGIKIVTRTPTSTTPPCPPVVMNTPDFSSNEFRKTILVILIQPEAYYGYSAQALDTINAVLPRVLEPGDDYYLVRMGAPIDDLDAALIFRGTVSKLTRPPIPATPTYVPTTTQTTTSVRTPQSAVGQQAATVQAQQTRTVLAATATQDQYLYNCAMLSWRDRYQETASAWEATRTKMVGGLTGQLQTNATGYPSTAEAMPTALRHTVYESLHHVTTIFKNYACGVDDRCFLIVFSDLNDWRPSPPDYVPFDAANPHGADLTGINVISVMYNCNLLTQCEDAQTKWTASFGFYGAYTPPAYMNADGLKPGDGLENDLINTLSRR